MLTVKSINKILLSLHAANFVQLQEFKGEGDGETRSATGGGGGGKERKICFSLNTISLAMRFTPEKGQN